MIVEGAMRHLRYEQDLLKRIGADWDARRRVNKQSTLPELATFPRLFDRCQSCSSTGRDCPYSSQVAGPCGSLARSAPVTVSFPR